MRASRLLSILLTLQTRGPTTSAQLARRLEVSVRTIHRDLQALGEAGVPVYAERGRGGGVRLLDGYRTNLTGLTAGEAETLFLAGLPGPAAQLGFETLAAAAQLKVLASLPKSVRDAATRTRNRFHLDPPGWFRTRMPEHPQLPAIASAVWNDRRLELWYWRPDRALVQRTVDPLGLVLKAGLWYLVTGTDVVYRVSRVRSVRETGERFERRDGFDLPSFWDSWARRFEADRSDASTMVLRVRPESVSILEDLDVGPSGSITRDPDGWLRVEVRCEAEHWARSAVLRLGDEVEVVEPDELRREVARIARTIARIYT